MNTKPKAGRRTPRPKIVHFLCASLFAVFLITGIGLLKAYAQTDPFITVWKTDNAGASNDNQIIIPGTGEYSISWKEVGNKTNTGSETGTDEHTITFPSPGKYIVSINGGLTRIQFGSLFGSFDGDQEKILDVQQWGGIAWHNMQGAFTGASNLKISATDAPNLAGVTSMNGMFKDASSLEGDFSGWETGNVTDMFSMFQKAHSFNGDIDGWDTGNVTLMGSMFSGASSFNRDISSWDTGKVTIMSRMFSMASSFNQNIGDWNTTEISSTSFMFYRATSFNQDLNYWDTGNVTSMSNMFDGATSFNGDIGGWNTAEVKYMDEMFRGASSFNQHIGNWNIGKMTDMDEMFRDASSFNQHIGNWDTGNVIIMEHMFRGASSFDQHIGNWDTGSVETMRNMFHGATSFNQDLSNWDTGNVELMSSIFRNAESFDQDLGDWDISSVTTMILMLENSGLSNTSYDRTLIGWADDENSSTPFNLELGTGGLAYCSGAEARDKLIRYGWDITGDREMCEPLASEVAMPADGDNDIEITPLLEWASSEGAESYDLQLSESSDFSDPILNLNAFDGTEYQVSEELAPETRYYWRVRAVNTSGASEWSVASSFTTKTTTSITGKDAPVTYELKQNYPNPFNPSTRIRYSVPEQAHVRLEVYNLLGQRISLLVNEAKGAGWHDANFDASAIPSGMYIYRIQTDAHVETRQMMLIK
ncbi:MAG: BspA family leucine-rich repeat surface protein [Balneolales bacterium]